MAGDGIHDPEWWATIGAIPVVGGIFVTMMKLRSTSKREIDRVRDDLDGFKIEVANKRATNSAVAEVEKRLSDALRDHKVQMNRIEDKLDRVIENEHK